MCRIIALTDESSPNFRSWLSMVSGERIAPEMSITAMLLGFRPSPAESVPLTERIVTQTMPVISRNTAASDPAMMPM
jgi:hypothetical protein